MILLDDAHKLPWLPNLHNAVADQFTSAVQCSAVLSTLHLTQSPVAASLTASPSGVTWKYSEGVMSGRAELHWGSFSPLWGPVAELRRRRWAQNQQLRPESLASVYVVRCTSHAYTTQYTVTLQSHWTVHSHAATLHVGHFIKAEN